MQPTDTSKINMQQNDPLENCPICLEKPEKVVKFSCSHSCCSECWKQMMKAANSNFKINDLKCFDLTCKKKIENLDSLVVGISERDVKDRFFYLQKKQEINKDKDKYLCPNKTCHKILHQNKQKQIKKDYSLQKKSQVIKQKNIENLDYSFMICDECTTIFCKICEIYHEPGKATCSQANQVNSEAIIKVLP